MELLFRSSASFENDLSMLAPAERTALIDRMNELFPGYLCDRESLCALLENPDQPRLRDGLCSSLSILRLDDDRTAILTIDDDPIFDQIIVTLIRLVPAAQSLQVCQEVQLKLHCGLLEEGPPAGGE